ncbi:hypothetical protein DX873_11780 [Flagellimonas nanhaiensis]|uniref:Uncharacterized protein n=1 Tax=Flagellimonas nanhaiensis TaxID=2292706 RepID=A0A371JR77_9FLAO|nr:hypothetical protein DX873_11780 [Allomuricauda nanhaiensis]
MARKQVNFAIQKFQINGGECSRNENDIKIQEYFVILLKKNLNNCMGFIERKIFHFSLNSSFGTSNVRLF